jgi:hypothetical protein
MSDSAPNTTEGDAAEQDEGVSRRVLQFGAAGRGRAEIAAALGMSPTVLMARESQDAGLAASLGEAAALSQAWWEAMAREACEAGRFNLGACTREMLRRFGESGAPAAPKTAPAAAPMPAPAEDWKAGEEPFPTKPRPGHTKIFLFPCNGRMKKGPDGKCRCGAYHNDAYWAAREAAYYAEHPDERPDPEPDDDDVLEDEE